MTTPTLLETYLRQIREVARGLDKHGRVIMEEPEAGLMRRRQIEKLSDLALSALAVMQGGIVSVRRTKTEFLPDDPVDVGSLPAGRDG